MSKEKVAKVAGAKPSKKAKVEVEESGLEATAVATTAEKSPKAVRFEGAEVVEVLSEGHTDWANHCKMSDGTTRHVPKELF